MLRIVLVSLPQDTFATCITTALGVKQHLLVMMALYNLVRRFPEFPMATTYLHNCRSGVKSVSLD